MLKVKIIAGTYGYKNGKRIEPKDRTSEPFELDDKEANRLVSIGVAEIVDTSVATPDNGEAATPKGVDPPEENDGERDEKEGAGGNDTPPDETELNGLTIAVLKEKAESMGINTSKFRVKKEYVDAIMEKVYVDAPPELGAEDPVV